MASTNEIAQINEINKALTTLNGTLDQTSAKYLTIVKTINDSQATVKLTVQTQENLTKAQKDTADTTAKLDAVGKQLAASEQKLKEVEDNRMKTIIENRVATQQSTQAIKDKVKAEQAEEGSLVRMRLKLSELTAQYDKTGTRTKEAAKEIDALSRAIGQAEASTNRHQRGVGGYADQLGKLPGPIGGVISGLQGVSKTLWLLVANPIGAVIAAIVAYFAALGAVFTSTAGGAKLIKEIMASVGAVLDVVKQSTVLVIDAFKALFSGEFSKAADLFGDSMDNLTDNTADAAKAAWNLVDAQSALNKELTFHVSEQAQENNLFQKNLFLSKDKTKSDKERMTLLKEALSVSEEQSKREVEYAKRQFVIDTDKAALKAKVSGVTADQLRAFIALGAEEQKTTLESSASLKKMWDLIGGSDKFKPLEESYAKIIDADTEFFQKNKRTIGQLSGLQNELAQEKIDRAKEAKDATDKQAKAEQDATDAFVKGMNEQIKANEDELKSKLDAIDKEEKELEDLRKSTIDGFNEEVDAFNKAEEEKKKISDKAEEEKEKKAEKEKDRQKDIRDASIQLARDSINAVFEMQNMKLEKEMTDLEKKKEKELSVKGLTEAQKLKIEADFDKKAGAIKTKQAQQAKVQALFDIAIGTAVSVMNAKGNIPLMVILGVMGAVQAALVAARPIPKFAKGTKDAPGFGIFGEAGREMMSLRSGELMMAEKATYFEGSKFKGARIFSNPETEKIIGASDRGIYGQQTDMRLLDKMDEVKKAILSKPVAIYDKDHRQIGLGNSKHQEIYLNRLTR